MGATQSLPKPEEKRSKTKSVETLQPSRLSITNYSIKSNISKKSIFSKKSNFSKKSVEHKKLSTENIINAKKPTIGKTKPVLTLCNPRPKQSNVQLLTPVEQTTPIQNYDIKQPNEAKLSVLSINIHHETNGNVHNTSMYDIMKRKNPSLVVRRGQPFRLSLSISRSYSSADVISFFFSIKNQKKQMIRKNCALSCKTKVLKVLNAIFRIPVWCKIRRRTAKDMIQNPMESFINHSIQEWDFSSRSEVIVVVVNTNKLPQPQKYIWSAICDFVSHDGKIIYLQITPAYDCIINRWSLTVFIESGNNFSKFIYDKFIYILFNAWCKDDGCYIKSEQRRSEYVLNDIGAVYKSDNAAPGDELFIKYGQYEDNILDWALDIIYSFIIFPLDDLLITKITNGLLHYITVDNPLVRIKKSSRKKIKDLLDSPSSRSILENYSFSRAPLKCTSEWVPNILLVTMYRAIGIPARLMSGRGFTELHNNSNLAETFFNSLLEELKSIKTSNYVILKVWTEVYIKRVDIGSEYDGWQYQTCKGLSSVGGIKNCSIYLPYNTLETCLEFNPELAHWKHSDSSVNRNELIGYSHARFPQQLFTKSEDKIEQKQVIKAYQCSIKELKCIPAELVSMSNTIVGRYCSHSNLDVNCALLCPMQIDLGSPISMNLDLKNKGNEERRISFHIIVNKIQDNGTSNQHFKVVTDTSRLAGKSNVQYDYVVPFARYRSKLDFLGFFRATCIAHIEGTDVYLIDERYFYIKHPNVLINIKPDEVINHFQVETIVKNPFSTPLLGSYFTLEDTGSKEKIKSKLLPEVKPHGVIKEIFSVNILKSGRYTMTAKFFSAHCNIVGFTEQNLKIK